MYLNLIKELSKREIIVKLIYFKDSWLTKELDRFNIHYKLFDLEIEKIENINSFLFPEDILIDTSFGGSLFHFYKINPYFLFWNVFPTALSSKANTSFKKYLFKRIIIKMLHKHGLVFMDDSGVKNLKRVFNIENNIHYLPIPIEIPSDYNEVTLSNIAIKNSKEFIPISYIGRAELWKVVPVKKLLINLGLITEELNKCFRIHIITDNKEEFDRLLDLKPTKSIKIEYHIDLYGEKLRKYLFNEILINFAMGTSCLESAALGVPSILLDFYSFTASSYVIDFKYRWLYETTNYNLGNLLEQNQPVIGHDLLEIFENSVSSNIYLKEESDKCFAYVRQNHNLEIVTNDFLKHIELCDNKLQPCLGYSLTHFKYKTIFIFLKRIIFFISKYKLFED